MTTLRITSQAGSMKFHFVAKTFVLSDVDEATYCDVMQGNVAWANHVFTNMSSKMVTHRISGNEEEKEFDTSGVIEVRRTTPDEHELSLQRIANIAVGGMINERIAYFLGVNRIRPTRVFLAKLATRITGPMLRAAQHGDRTLWAFTAVIAAAAELLQIQDAAEGNWGGEKGVVSTKFPKVFILGAKAERRGENEFQITALAETSKPVSGLWLRAFLEGYIMGHVTHRLIRAGVSMPRVLVRIESVGVPKSASSMLIAQEGRTIWAFTATARSSAPLDEVEDALTGNWACPRHIPWAFALNVYTTFKNLTRSAPAEEYIVFGMIETKTPTTRFQAEKALGAMLFERLKEKIPRGIHTIITDEVAPPRENRYASRKRGSGMGMWKFHTQISFTPDGYQPSLADLQDSLKGIGSAEPFLRQSFLLSAEASAGPIWEGRPTFYISGIAEMQEDSVRVCTGHADAAIRYIIAGKLRRLFGDERAGIPTWIVLSPVQIEPIQQDTTPERRN